KLVADVRTSSKIPHIEITICHETIAVRELRHQSGADEVDGIKPFTHHRTRAITTVSKLPINWIGIFAERSTPYPEMEMGHSCSRRFAGISRQITDELTLPNISQTGEATGTQMAVN